MLLTPLLTLLIAMPFLTRGVAAERISEERVDKQGTEGTRPAEPTSPHTEPSERLSSELVPKSGFLNERPLEKPANERRLEEFARYREQILAGREYRLAVRNDAARATLIPLMEGAVPTEIQQAALLELGLVAEQEKEFSRAQQIYNQFLKRFPDSTLSPEVLLRQGLIYREMGTPTLALAKFYSVGTSSMSLKDGNLENYKRIVLQAQTEIANTYFLQGKFDDAAEFFQRLLKQSTGQLHRAQIHYKIVQCQEKIGRDKETAAAAEEFLRHYATAPEAPEIRFLLANAYKKMGRTRDSLQEVSRLLVSQQAVGKTNRAAWAYWQQRAGNEIATQLYQEGDYVNALEVYSGLLPLSSRLDWQAPLLYQLGLIYEKLAQPPKADESYRRILSLTAAETTNITSTLRSVAEMARWRADQLQWQVQAERTNAFFTSVRGSRLPPQSSGTGTPPAPPKP